MERSTDEPLYHLGIVDVRPHTLRRWSDLAAQLGEDGLPLRIELADLEGDTTRHRLTRCARAARIVEAVCPENWP